MSKIAVFSDSHDNLSNIALAVEQAKRVGAEFIIHAGDFVAPFSLKALMDSGIEWRGVFGNNDGERKGLATKSDHRIVEQPLSINLSGKNIIVVHEPQNIKDAFFSSYDIIIYGHTHQVDIRKEKGALVVNPGELCGYLTGRPSIAIIDLTSLEVDVVYLS